MGTINCKPLNKEIRDYKYVFVGLSQSHSHNKKGWVCMKKAIIISACVIVLGVLGFFGYKFVNNAIETSGPVDSIPPTIMVNDIVMKTNSSSSEEAFQFIKDSQRFALSNDKITKAISHDKLPTENLTSNFEIVVGKEMYVSPDKPNEVYIKTEVNKQIRYYRFEGNSQATTSEPQDTSDTPSSDDVSSEDTSQPVAAE